MKPKGCLVIVGGIYMKEMTKKEITMLGRDLNKAKMQVLKKYGFNNEEIANIMGIPESVVRREIDACQQAVK